MDLFYDFITTGMVSHVTFFFDTIKNSYAQILPDFFFFTKFF